MNNIFVLTETKVYSPNDGKMVNWYHSYREAPNGEVTWWEENHPSHNSARQAIRQLVYSLTCGDFGISEESFWRWIAPQVIYTLKTWENGTSIHPLFGIRDSPQTTSRLRKLNDITPVYPTEIQMLEICPVGGKP